MTDPSLPVFDPQPVSLGDDHVLIEPLAPAHTVDLTAAGADDSIWPWMPRGPFADEADCAGWIADALAAAATGTSLPFAIIEVGSGRAVGSTRYLDIRRSDRGLEIGWTWLGVPWQRSAINTACKRLLMAHAFETLGAERVQLKTDARNERSKRAIERIGAVREGTLRKHMRVRDGFLRDTVYYSVIASEWPAVRQRLDELIRR